MSDKGKKPTRLLINKEKLCEQRQAEEDKKNRQTARQNENKEAFITDWYKERNKHSFCLKANPGGVVYNSVQCWVNTADAIRVTVVCTFTFSFPTFSAQAQHTSMFWIGQSSLEHYILNYENSQVTGSKPLATTLYSKHDLIESNKNMLWNCHFIEIWL